MILKTVPVMFSDRSQISNLYVVERVMDNVIKINTLLCKTQNFRTETIIGIQGA